MTRVVTVVIIIFAAIITPKSPEYSGEGCHPCCRPVPKLREEHNVRNEIYELIRIIDFFLRYSFS